MPTGNLCKPGRAGLPVSRFSLSLNLICCAVGKVDNLVQNVNQILIMPFETIAPFQQCILFLKKNVNEWCKIIYVEILEHNRKKKIAKVQECQILNKADKTKTCSYNYKFFINIANVNRLQLYIPLLVYYYYFFSIFHYIPFTITILFSIYSYISLPYTYLFKQLKPKELSSQTLKM